MDVGPTTSAAIERLCVLACLCAICTLGTQLFCVLVLAGNKQALSVVTLLCEAGVAG